MDREKDRLSRFEWWDEIENRLFSRSANPLKTAQQALQSHPDDADILELAAFAALVEEQPELALRYLKKLERRYFADASVYACKAIALAQSGKWPQAQSLLVSTEIDRRMLSYCCPEGLNPKWVNQWAREIIHWQPKAEPARRPHKAKPHRKMESASAPAVAPAKAPPPATPPLPRYDAVIPIRLSLPDSRMYDLLDRGEGGSAEDFLLRHDLAHATLFQTFDELLCLPHLRGVDHYWYQVETARKVLKQFRGRVLLADEVGLGKTIEAGMALKEYMLRGMVERVLILTPPALVGQ